MYDAQLSKDLCTISGVKSFKFAKTNMCVGDGGRQSGRECKHADKISFRVINVSDGNKNPEQ